MPDSIQIDDDAMLDVAARDAEVRKVADGFQFIEGPAWVRDRLVFSDIPQNRMHFFRGGEVSVYREPSHNANGNTVDPGGHLVTCEHATRLVSVTEPAIDGQRRVLVETFDHDGKPAKFNSPNDCVVHAASGAIYFTDPYWGLPAKNRAELMEYGEDQCWVFRVEADGTGCRPVAKDFRRPNGLAFTPDHGRLFVGDDERKHVRRFDVADDGSLSGGEVFCEIDVGVPDGMRVDRGGRLFCTAGDGVHVFAPDGKRLGKLLCPEGVANCEFGGEGRRTLYMTANTGLYAVDLKTGAA